MNRVKDSRFELGREIVAVRKRLAVDALRAAGIDVKEWTRESIAALDPAHYGSLLLSEFKLSSNTTIDLPDQEVFAGDRLTLGAFSTSIDAAEYRVSTWSSEEERLAFIGSMRSFAEEAEDPSYHIMTRLSDIGTGMDFGSYMIVGGREISPTILPNKLVHQIDIEDRTISDVRMVRKIEERFGPDNVVELTSKSCEAIIYAMQSGEPAYDMEGYVEW